MSRSRRPQVAAMAAIAALMTFTAAASRAQTAQPASTAPEVGQMAPDFSARGATRYGVLKDPVSLADFRGKTVVLAFFYKARTKG